MVDEDQLVVAVPLARGDFVQAQAADRGERGTRRVGRRRVAIVDALDGAVAMRLGTRDVGNGVLPAGGDEVLGEAARGARAGGDRRQLLSKGRWQVAHQKRRVRIWR